MKKNLQIALLVSGLLLSGSSFGQTYEASTPRNIVTMSGLPGTSPQNSAAPLYTYNQAYGGNALFIYPNPVQSNTRILLNEVSYAVVNVDIIDMNGNIERSQQFAPGTYDLDIDMSRLSAGLYSVRVYGKGMPYYNLKVVKQ